MVGESVSLTLNTAPVTNEVQGTHIGYDAAGNMTTDNLGTAYTYDAEGRMSAAGSELYLCNGDGVRVGKAVGSTGRLYWPDLRGAAMNETGLTGTGGVRNVYVGGVQVAREDASGNWIYPLQDNLGSTRAVLNASGAKVYDVDYYPYGALALSSGSTTNLYGFTGYETDTESGTNYAVFRNQSGTIGRFLRPDPYDGSYDVTNPQSLNRYTYVSNNPLSSIDPQGLDPCIAFEGGYDCTITDPPPQTSPTPDNTIYMSVICQGYGCIDPYQGLPACTGGCIYAGNYMSGYGNQNGGSGGGGTGPPNNQPSKLQSCLSKTWAATNKTGLALDAAGALLTLAAPEASPLIGLALAAIGSASAYQSFNDGVSVSNFGAGAVSLGGASVSAAAPSAHFFSGASKFTASLKSVSRGFAAASIIIDAANFAEGVSTCMSR
jgi:RHS repeat-associated protein